LQPEGSSGSANSGGRTAWDSEEQLAYLIAHRIQSRRFLFVRLSGHVDRAFAADRSPHFVRYAASGFLDLRSLGEGGQPDLASPATALRLQ
jgi:hypothetical protein